MKINIEDVHPKEKFEYLMYMMDESIREIRKMDNHNPVMNKCPICNDENIEFFTKAHGFDMSLCNTCGLIFCNPYPSEEQLYACYNCEAKQLENELFRETFEKRVNIFLPRVELIKQYKKNGSLLDVGSAIGVFEEALLRSDMSYQVTCCELNEDACKELKERYSSINIINMDFLKIDETSKYDIITLWDTVEHIVDLNAMLQKIRNLLNDNGVFVFSTPNTGSFEWIIAWKKHGQLAPPTHVNLMNRRSIKILLSNNRFQIIDAKTLNASLDITYVKNLIENDQLEIERLGVFLKEELYNSEFEKVLEQYLVNNNKAGNIVVVAKKNCESDRRCS